MRNKINTAESLIISDQPHNDDDDGHLHQLGEHYGSKA